MSYERGWCLLIWYSISYGIAVCEAANGLRELVREADEKMLGSKRAYYAEHDRRRPR